MVERDRRSWVDVGIRGWLWADKIVLVWLDAAGAWPAILRRQQAAVAPPTANAPVRLQEGSPLLVVLIFVIDELVQISIIVVVVEAVVVVAVELARALDELLAGLVRLVHLLLVGHRSPLLLVSRQSEIELDESARRVGVGG